MNLPPPNSEKEVILEVVQQLLEYFCKLEGLADEEYIIDVSQVVSALSDLEDSLERAS